MGDLPISAEASDRVAAEMQARRRLTAKFGDDNARQELDKEDQPMPAADLIEYVVDTVRLGPRVVRPEATAQPDDVQAALTLIGTARRDLDTLERNAIQVARELGLTWKQIAQTLALDSPQAAQQRFRRLSGTTDTP